MDYHLDLSAPRVVMTETPDTAVYCDSAVCVGGIFCTDARHFYLRRILVSRHDENAHMSRRRTP